MSDHSEDMPDPFILDQAMDIETASQAICPICHDEAPVAAFAPFCSEKCRQVDLNRWLGEGYRLADDD